MPPYLFADVGPPPGLFFGFVACGVLAVVPLVSGLVLFGLWLARRNRRRKNEQREVK